MQVRKLRLKRGPPSQRGGASTQSWCCLGAVFLLHLSSSQHPNPGLLRSHTPASLSPCPPRTQAVGGVGSGRILWNRVETAQPHPVQSHFCCARLCTHTSLLHARRSVSCMHSWPLGNTCPGVSQAHTQHTSNAKKSNAQLLPPFLRLHRRTPGPAPQPRPLGRS